MLISDTLIIHAEPLFRHAKGEDVITFFGSNPKASLCPIVDEDNHLVGSISRVKFQNRIGKPFGRPLVERKPVMELVDAKSRSVSRETRLETVFQGLGFEDAHHLQDGFVVVDPDGSYHGLVSGITVLAALNELTNDLVTSLKREVEDRKEAEDRVRKLAETDPLTGLRNRRAFLRCVDDRIAKQAPFACVFVDLDRFKAVNDQYGHAVGDAVLIETAKRLEDVNGLYGTARLGGDEFAILLPLSDNLPVETRLEQLFATIISPVGCGELQITIGASIGWAAYPRHADRPAQLLHSADKAMLRIKANGGGVVQFDRILDFANLDQTSLETQLRASVFADGIKPAIQPVLDLKTRKTVGHEVLARWPNSGIHPEPGPSSFIPVAERAALIDPLFWSLARQVFDVTGTQKGFFALNVSPSQLNSTVFASRMANMLKEYGLEGGRLELEITENVLVRNGDEAVRTLNQLRDLGIRICLDDFGTGYASLSMLTQLPLDKVKIDSSFVTEGLETDIHSSAQILEATIALCHRLGFQSCAEGVESERVLRKLEAMGCDLAQGFHIGRPTLLKPETPQLVALA